MSEIKLGSLVTGQNSKEIPQDEIGFVYRMENGYATVRTLMGNTYTEELGKLRILLHHNIITYIDYLLEKPQNNRKLLIGLISYLAQLPEILEKSR